MNRTTIADSIVLRLTEQKLSLQEMFAATKNGISYFYIDNLLPEEIVSNITSVFPKKEAMVQKKSLREYKYVAAQMDSYNPLLEEVVYAFQDPRVVTLVSDITSITGLEADEHLYAGGISLMAEHNFLNPHIDNSHDKNRDKWRVLNLLYYVTPNWQDNYGGHLEIWPNGLEQQQETIHSTYNRLVVMATHQRSWHSVSPVVYPGSRCCVSNYYFSDSPLKKDDAFHVTSFRARPGQKLKYFILTSDARLRMAIRKFFKKGIKENPHVYKKKPD